MRLFKHRKTNNVIFSLFQANDAWSFLRDPQTPYDFYGENLDFLIKSQVKYAEIVGADYYHFRDDFVSLIKHSLPKLTKMKMFVFVMTPILEVQSSMILWVLQQRMA